MGEENSYSLLQVCPIPDIHIDLCTFNVFEYYYSRHMAI